MIRINRKDADFILDFAKSNLEVYAALVRNYNEIVNEIFKNMVERHKNDSKFDYEYARTMGEANGQKLLLDTVNAYKNIIATFEGNEEITITESKADEIATFIRNKVQYEIDTPLENESESDKKDTQAISDIVQKNEPCFYDENSSSDNYNHQKEIKILEILMVGSND